MIEFKKIDRRYNGGNVYRYMLLVKVSFGTGGTGTEITAIKEFNELRKWCQDTWGHSYELHDAWVRSVHEDWPSWVWANDSKDSKRAIYLRTDKEYMLAKLRWS